MIKLLTALSLSVASACSFATKCISKDVSDIYPVKVITKTPFMLGMHEYTISVPSEIESITLLSIYLFSSDSKGVVEDNLMVPIQHYYELGAALAKFSINPEAASYKLQVWYGSECGPRLWHAIK